MKDIVSKIIFAVVVVGVGAWIVANNVSSQRIKVEKKNLDIEKRVQISANCNSNCDKI